MDYKLQRQQKYPVTGLRGCKLINDDAESVSGSLIREKAGSPEPLHELVPKLTSNEFCATEILLNEALKINRVDRLMDKFFYHPVDF